MNWIVIEPKPYNGRYELVLPHEFKQREWGWAKRLAGYLPGNVDEGLDGYDPELIGVMALAALYRAGKIQERDAAQVFERFQDFSLGAIKLESDEQPEETDADPPPPSLSENGSTSGVGSPTSLETSAGLATPSGSPSSATSESAPTTSVT